MALNRIAEMARQDAGRRFCSIDHFLIFRMHLMQMIEQRGRISRFCARASTTLGQPGEST
jgi:hypothetical protein